MKDTFLQDIMLGEYFRLTCLFGSLGGEEKRAFNALADIFVVGERERAALYDLTEHGSAAEISSAADHRRYCRVREYLSLMGEDADVSEALAMLHKRALSRAERDHKKAKRRMRTKRLWSLSP